jgi:tRNA(Ser,Leu) C12 N-acetylase TAN1
MEEEANLLVTFDPENFQAARYEAKETLEDIGEGNPQFLHSKVHGLFKLRVHLDPKDVTRELDALCREAPSKFWYTYHWIPVEEWCPSTVAEMSEVVQELAERIAPEERWRMRINKRFYEEHHTQDLIEELTAYVDRPNVDLDNPEKTIRIEIIGGQAALSLLEPREHFSVNDVKDDVLGSENKE